MNKHLAGLGLAAALAAAAPGDALAQRRDAGAYIGTWSANARNCRVSQERPRAPLVIRRLGYDQYETHCWFRSVRQIGWREWRAVARCRVDGDRQQHTFTMRVRNDRLTLRDARGARSLVRCG
jgi:hypothetical protein